MESRSHKLFGIIVFLQVCFIAGGLYFLFLLKNDTVNLNSKIQELRSKIDSNYNYDLIDEEISFYQNIDTEIENKYEEYYSNIALLEQKILNNETDVKIAYLTFDKVLWLSKSYDIASQMLVKTE